MEIRGQCPHHMNSDTNGSDSYFWNEEKQVGNCKSCGLSTFINSEGKLMGKHDGMVFEIGEEVAVKDMVEKTDAEIFGDTPTKDDSAGEYLPLRGIVSSTMQRYGVKTYGDKYQRYIYPSGAWKDRFLQKKDFRGSSQKNGEPQFSSNEFFGKNLFAGVNAKYIVITEGELDAMSAFQMLNGGTYLNPVVSLPGAEPKKDLFTRNNQENRLWLDKFERIVLSLDNDEAGQQVLSKFTEMFPGKIYVMDHGPYKDANEFLQAGKGKQYKDAFWGATRYVPDTIVSGSDSFLKLYDDTPDFEYFTTGIPKLDDKMLGINKGYVTLIQAETGTGKSLAPNTPVLKFDGSVVRADEVNVGDQLMGPDSTPRNVTDVNLQRGPMYRITPVKGSPFECNADHILSLKHTSSGDIKNVVLTDYLGWSKTEKHKWKLWRTGVEFQTSFNDNSFIYAVGAYLGDGCRHNPRFTMGKKKQPIIDFLIGNRVIQPTTVTFDRGCYSIPFSRKDRLWTFLSSVGALDERHIPQKYKVCDSSGRKYLLAGLLDTDGSVSGSGAEITQKSERLADDICFVARSLGLAAYKKEKWVNGTKYFRVNISGDLTELPCQRLKFNDRKQIKSVLRTGFTVEPIGEGTYRGIALDGDHLFLLGDFTVTHNTEVMRYLEHRLLSTTSYTLATNHLEESQTRSLLGLVSYDLQDNLTLKKFVQEKDKDEEVRESIQRITADDRLLFFDVDATEHHNKIVRDIQFLAAIGVDFVFLEPIQDCVTGTSSEKEGKLADLITQLSSLAARVNIGIVLIAHQNSDGGAMYSSMITKRAAFEILLKRDSEATDPIEKDRTHIYIGRKNRVGMGNGYAGALDFKLDKYMLFPVLEESSAPVKSEDLFK